MRTDSDLEYEVVAELRNNADIGTPAVSCTVAERVVTLHGTVQRLYQRHEAARTAWSVPGVSAVINHIIVGQPTGTTRADPELQREIVARLKFWLPESWNQIKVTVESGHADLEGLVAWHYERDRAEGVARSVKGIASVGNAIRVVPLVAAQDVQRAIEETFMHRAEIDAHRVGVSADGSEVTLRGRVHSCGEREQAQRSAWSTPGVTRVTNNLRVKP